MAESRYALIIANSEYRDSEFGELVAPAQDADALVDVLKDPRIGGYTVTDVRNAESSAVSEQIETFCSERERDELALIYFSCHGVKGKDGRLYLATTNTRRAVLRSTSVPASFVTEVMSASDAKRQVLVLDCCYSGAFSRGMQIKSGGHVSVMEDFEGEGRAVLTASTAMQYAFVDDERTLSKGARSLLTSALVAGLQTGEADSDGDGLISFDELYTFARNRVRERSKDQDPERNSFGLKGELILARSVAPRGRAVAPPSEAIRPTAATAPPIGPIAYEGTITALALADDGSRLVIVGRDALSVWETDLGQSEGREIKRIDHELGELCAIAVSRNGRLVALGVADAIDQVEEPGPLNASSRDAVGAGDIVDNASEAGSSEEPGNLIKALRFARRAWDTLNAPPRPPRPARPSTLHVWDTKTGRKVASMKHGGLSALAFNTSGRLIVGGGNNQVMRVWDVKTGQEVGKFRNQAKVNAVSFSPDARYVACATKGGVQLWQRSSGERKATLGEALRKPAGRASPDTSVPAPEYKASAEYMSVAFSPDGHYLASAAGNKVYVWEAKTGKERARIRESANEILFTEGYLATFRWGEARLWEPGTGRPVKLAKSSTSELPFRPLRVSGADGNHVVRSGGKPVLMKETAIDPDALGKPSTS